MQTGVLCHARLQSPKSFFNTYRGNYNLDVRLLLLCYLCISFDIGIRWKLITLLRPYLLSDSGVSVMIFFFRKNLLQGCLKDLKTHWISCLYFKY